jgi:CIC family chloride channel protein
MGLAFKAVLYRTEDLCDRLWQGRPEWARPAVGGIALGLLLLALPQMYGVGYPVLYQAVGGSYALWFLIILAAGKIIACSLTIGIGGSGGVFAPSLFIGATSGMAFGEIARHLFGPAAGQPALYAVVAMGAVFTAAARAPLTSVASVVEMTGDFTLTLPVMLAVAIATATSRALSYGTIYTTKLLRRGQDLDRAAPWRAFGDLKAGDAMRPFPVPLPVPGGHDCDAKAREDGAGEGQARLPGPVIYVGDPQAVYAGESLAQTMRQLQAYGRDGLPVLSGDGREVQGWITNQSVLETVADRIGGSPRQDSSAAGQATPGRQPGQSEPPAPLHGYRVIEVSIGPDSPAQGRPLSSLSWPPGTIPVSVLRGRKLREPDPDLSLAEGDRVSLLIPAAPRDQAEEGHTGTSGPPRPPEVPADH